MVMTMLEKFLKSEHAREKILACKMFPCLRKSPNKVSLMISYLSQFSVLDQHPM